MRKWDGVKITLTEFLRAYHAKIILAIQAMSYSEVSNAVRQAEKVCPR